MITGVVIATLVVTATGCLIGFFLVFAGKKFEVKVDEKEAAVLEALPGNNCGGCGYAGCAALAKAIANGEAPVNQCPVGGAPVGNIIAGIMGVEAGESIRKVAYVHCAGTCDKAKDRYEYSGTQDCNALKLLPGGGPKSCNYGCLGRGSCVDACEFDAIHIVDGIAKVNKENCKACSKCINVCPQHIIDLQPYDSAYDVTCSSKDKGKDVMTVCDIGCIACHICEKNCPHDAVHVIDNIAVIDQDKCVGCGICADKCPKKVIIKQSGEIRSAEA